MFSQATFSRSVTGGFRFPRLSRLRDRSHLVSLRMRYSSPSIVGSGFLLHRGTLTSSGLRGFNDCSGIMALMSTDTESRPLIDGLESGLYDALQKKTLKALFFLICERRGDGPFIDEYLVSFSYSQDIMVNVKRITKNKRGGAFNFADYLKENERSNAFKLVRTLVQLMQTLVKSSEEGTMHQTILMQLQFGFIASFYSLYI